MADDDAFRRGQWVAHLSGATPLEALGPARSPGAGPLGIHPLQTFPDPAAGIARIPGSLIALAADDDAGFFVAERLADDLMGVPFRLADEHRALYHAAAVFASNYVVAATAVAEQLLAAAGVPDPAAAMGPLQRATVENVASLGPAAALTGPAVRGDAGTIERNLEALVSSVALGRRCRTSRWRASRSTSPGGGRLDDRRRDAVEEVLARWSLIGSPTDLRALTDAPRAAGATVGLVPTMGGLHEGHDSLIERARAERDHVVVSIFVNPLQFDDPDDLSHYPVDRERDLARCRQLGVDTVWMPSVGADVSARRAPGLAAARAGGRARSKAPPARATSPACSRRCTGCST